MRCQVEEIYGGALLGVRSTDFVCFYDWTTAKVRPAQPGIGRTRPVLPLVHLSFGHVQKVVVDVSLVLSSSWQAIC